MNSENQAESSDKDEIKSDKVSENFTNSTQCGRKGNANLSECMGKSTKSNQKGEELPWCEVSNIIYRAGDCVYIESQRPEVPYFICSIRDIRRSKRDQIFVNVTWFYRPCEVPTSVYQLLIHDRNHENGADHVLEDPAVKERELFISDSVDTYPILALRGHINVVSFSDVKHRLKEYTEEEDNWFYILRYNPESRRLANTKGEIRVGSNHQVKLPKCVPLQQRSLKGNVRKCPEQLVWTPKLEDKELLAYIRASRSISSYSGYVDDDASVDKALSVLSEDSTTFHSMNLLHKSKYDTSKALQSLVRLPFPKIYKKKWSDEDRKLFVKGLRQYGKNFNKIRRELLPKRDSKELVEYYYIWKKTPTAINSRPHKRGRRHNVLSRKTRSTKGKSSLASEFLDLSSCSEEEPDSEDSERDLSLYACRHCYETSKILLCSVFELIFNDIVCVEESPNWHHVGKDKLLVCKICRIYFKKYGRMRPIENPIEPPSFIFKAAFENHDDDLTYTGRMRTRRSATPIFPSNGSVRTRILQEIQEARLSRILRKPDSPSTNSSESPVCFKEAGQENSRKRNRESGTDYDDDQDEIDEEEDEEIEKKRSRDELMDESDTSSDAPSSYDSAELSSGPEPETNNPVSEPSPENMMMCDDVIVKQEQPDDDVEYECPSSPDVANDPKLDAKVESRFRRNDGDNDRNACARCGLVYVIKRPKKEKSLKPVSTPTKKEKCEKIEPTKERFSESSNFKSETSPPPSAPAHITSQFQTALRNYIRMTGDDPRNNPNFPFLWPHFNQYVSFPHDMAPGHHFRSHSPPVEQHAGVDYHSKFGHLLEIFSRHGAPIGGGHSGAGHSSHNVHNAHSGHSVIPGQHVRPHTAHGRPHSAQGHSHPELPLPGQSSVPVFPGHHNRPNNPNIDGISRTSPRPPHIDPATGLPYAYGHPHLHSHLHTHTHLHLHPSENENRHGPAATAPGAREPHPPQPSSAGNPHPLPGHPPALGLPHESGMLRHQPDFLHHLQEHRMRNPLVAAGGSGGPGGLPAREGAISPGMLHEYYRHDPATYHLWLNQAARLQQEQQQHFLPDPQHPSAHQRLLAENEDYIRHMRSLELDSKFKSEHIGASERALQLGERGLPLGERGLPLGERGLPLGERGLPLGERGLPLGERGLPLGERGLPLTERGLSLSERGLPLGERGLPLGGERGVPRGEHFPFSAAYLENIRRLHGRLTPPTGLTGKPVTIDLCED
eukprot:gene15048-16601_t